MGQQEMPRKKEKKKRTDKMPKIEAARLDCLSLSRTGIPAERLAERSYRGSRALLPYPPTSWIKLRNYITVTRRPLGEAVPEAWYGSFCRHPAEHRILQWVRTRVS